MIPTPGEKAAMTCVLDGRIPHYKFGLIADVQYADSENGFNFSRTNERFYRRSLTLLKEAVDVWKKCDVDSVLQLGDVIDGKCKGIEQSDICLQRVLDQFDELQRDVYHVWGNHELYNFDRKWLMTSDLAPKGASRSPPDCAYYSVDLHPQLRLVALDCYEVSLLGVDKSYRYFDQAWETLSAINKNATWNSPEGLVDLERRFLKYNGGCSTRQVQWLNEELAEARRRKQNVIVIGHSPVLESSGHASNLLWNFDEILQVLSAHKDSVLCYCCGHDHDGGFDQDEAGIHHITLPGVIEAVDNNPFGTAYLYDNHLMITGNGSVPNFCINLKYPINTGTS
ncbi:manganese-dependent ADP-ribose/CDP-alcohol diphosphatase-like isoform X2 [Ostrea edulis]|uniref:manganese-dependent ADP-ribose/CDP-alcohol diphosphatase-like isoform X2 n=1 Tax=Ostrea edulis TaxID=37623 RepID=UPI0024AECDBC|nr:manganese-dependent ADP-ribose/CDP-alcohol diphosphatase-like isoform X2 [Ostrea edulis]